VSTRLQRIKYKAVRFALELAIIAAALAVSSFFVSTPAHAADSWTGADKGKHVIAGALIAGTALTITDSPKVSMALAAAAAVGKELVDAHRTGHVASYRDATATALGAVVAVNVNGLTITPISVYWSARW